MSETTSTRAGRREWIRTTSQTRVLWEGNLLVACSVISKLLGKVTGEIDGPQDPPNPRPMFALPNGSYPRITVEVEKDPAIDITPELPPGDE